MAESTCFQNDVELRSHLASLYSQADAGLKEKDVVAALSLYSVALCFVDSEGEQFTLEQARKEFEEDMSNISFLCQKTAIVEFTREGKRQARVGTEQQRIAVFFQSPKQLTIERFVSSDRWEQQEDGRWLIGECRTLSYSVAYKRRCQAYPLWARWLLRLLKACN